MVLNKIVKRHNEKLWKTHIAVKKVQNIIGIIHRFLLDNLVN